MQEKLPKNLTLRELIHFYLIDVKTLPGKIIDAVILFLNLAVCAIFVIETYEISQQFFNILHTIEIVIVFIFIVEYILRLYGSENRIRHIINIYSIIDLISILPTIVLLIISASPINIAMIMMFRILKVFRVFRFLRYMSNPEFFFGTIQQHLFKVFRLIVTILIIFFLGSGLFWISEFKLNPHVSNFGDAFYFTVVTLTTVGFGDITPLTTEGRWVTVLMIISGIILIPWQASQIVRQWALLSNKKNIICPQCGLRYHDKDASHCKSCGQVIYQEFDGY